MQCEQSMWTKQNSLPNSIIQGSASSWSDFHNAAATGDVKKLQSLVSGNIDFTVKESKNGNTPLHEASWRGYSRCVKILCKSPNLVLDHSENKMKGILLETRDSVHSTILNIRNKEGCTALHLAAQKGHNQSCRELLLAGANPDLQNYCGDTALHTACRYGHAGAIRILLSAACSKNKRNLNGDTPLHICCAMGRRKLTRILIDANCDIDVKNLQNETPRDIALRKNFMEILDILNVQNQKSKVEYKSKEKTNSVPVSSNCVSCTNEISWSPYGCHYFLDALPAQSAKLEIFPTEPLKKGEQYYWDLTGHIRKGPIIVGNNCYCRPFFKHIEDKIQCNKELKPTEDIPQKSKSLQQRCTHCTRNTSG